jgi:hypothetical protein
LPVGAGAETINNNKQKADVLKSGLLSGRTEARLCAAVRKASIRLCDRGAGERQEYQILMWFYLT